MGDFLNFNPNRGLEFSPGHPLEFDSRRTLEFDSGRDLEFNENRDLGFGRRGVVFRGFVCPICGALVTEDAKRCSECGAVFEVDPRLSGPPAPPTAPLGPKKMTKPAGQPSRAGVATGTTFCPHCGVMLKRADAFCWNCGARTPGAPEFVKLPAQKPEADTREWRPGR